VLEETNDGFALAEKDLRLRGEGNVLGDRQHGMPDLKLASLLDDIELVEQARQDAFAIVARDPHLSAPERGPLKREVRRAFAAAWQWVSSG
jgi:ATP-dependent DNA helicase RecG